MNELISKLNHTAPIFDIIEKQAALEGKNTPKEVFLFKKHLENMKIAYNAIKNKSDIEEIKKALTKADQAVLFFEYLNKNIPDSLIQIKTASERENMTTPQFLRNKILDSINFNSKDWLYNIQYKNALNTVSNFYKVTYEIRKKPHENENNEKMMNQAFSEMKDSVFSDPALVKEIILNQCKDISELSQMEHMFAFWDKNSEFLYARNELKQVKKDYTNQSIEEATSTIVSIANHADQILEDLKSSSEGIFDALSEEVNSIIKQHVIDMLDSSIKDNFKNKDYDLIFASSNKNFIKKVENKLNHELKGIAHINIKINPEDPEGFISHVTLDIKNNQESADIFNDFLYSTSPIANKILERLIELKSQNNFILNKNKHSNQLIWVPKPLELKTQFATEFIEDYEKYMKIYDQKSEIIKEINPIIQRQKSISNTINLIKEGLNNIEIYTKDCTNISINDTNAIVEDVLNLNSVPFIDLENKIEHIEKKAISLFSESNVTEDLIILLFSHLSSIKSIIADIEQQHINIEDFEIPISTKQQLDRLKKRILPWNKKQQKKTLDIATKFMAIASKYPQSNKEKISMLNYFAKKIYKNTSFHQELSNIILNYSKELKSSL